MEEIFLAESTRILTQSGKIESNMDELADECADTCDSSKKQSNSNQNLSKENKTDIENRDIEGQQVNRYDIKSKNTNEKEMMDNSKGNNNLNGSSNEINNESSLSNSQENIDYANYSLKQNKKELKDNSQENNHKNNETILSKQLKQTQENCIINKQIEVEPLNIKSFNENKHQNKINFEKLIPFISLEEIVNSKKEIFLKELWENGNVFENKDELVKIEECEIFKKIADYLRNGKNQRKNKKEKKKRKTDRDQMMIKILTHLAQSFLKATKSFKEFKNFQIAPMERNLINIHLKPDFIFEYLGKPLTTILSNKSSDINQIDKKVKIEKIINENDKNQEVVKHLNLTVQKCLDYFRYEEENPRFDYKLVDYLIKEFESQKVKENINFAKAYIVSLLLITYNFERFFQKKKKNSGNKDKEYIVKKLINKVKNKNEKCNIDEPFNSSNKNKIFTILSLDKNDSKVETYLSNYIFQENQTLPIKTIDGKPHFLDLNKGILIMHNQDKEDQIYKEIFDNSLSSKEYEDDSNQKYDDIYYMKPLKINLEPFNYSTFQQKYKNNINEKQNIFSVTKYNDEII